MILGFIVAGVLCCCCFYTCQKLCPNGCRSGDMDMDDDVNWSNVRTVELAVDKKANDLSVS